MRSQRIGFHAAESDFFMRSLTPTLWIGNGREARDMTRVHAQEIQAIVDLAAGEAPVQPTRDLIYARIPLTDGAGNPADQLSLAVRIVQQLLRSGTRTLVACSAGMSRSPLIAAAALALVEERSLNSTLQAVAEVGGVDVSPGLLNDVRRLFDNPE